MKIDLKNMNIKELEKVVTDLGEQKFQAKNIFSWIHQKNCFDIEKMTNLSKDFRKKLKSHDFYISTIKVFKKLEDPDGTVKYVFELEDTSKIETVILFDKERKTICLSTQLGCSCNCDFCNTAALKKKRDLTTAEIVDQVIQLENEGYKANNLVYMGMGEPLLNYENVLRSIRILNDKNGKNIGARHITISTVGIIPEIKRLAQENMQIRLAVSLHASTDKIRDQLIPINKKYPIEKLINAVKEYQKATDRRVTFEYILLKGVTDSREQARGLMKRIKGIKCNVNLIEFNDFPGTKYKASDRKTIKEFRWLLQDRGFEVNLRPKKGNEVKAACGQLGAHAI